MSNENIAAGTIAIVKVGRNEVEVTVVERLGDGWKVKSNSSGREFKVRAIERVVSGQSNVAEIGQSPVLVTAAATGNAEETPETPRQPVAPVAVPGAVTPESAPESGAPVTAKKLSLLDAAAQVLKKSRTPMSSKEIVGKAIAAGLWSLTAAKTPEQSLYSAMFREIRDKSNSRFKKSVEHKGSFEYNR